MDDSNESEPSTSPSKRLRLRTERDPGQSQSQSVPLPVKKAKANSTVVHEEFTLHKFMVGGEEREGSTCKHCGYPMKDKNATNLKNHLKRKHPDIFEKVKGEI